MLKYGWFPQRRYGVDQRAPAKVFQFLDGEAKARKQIMYQLISQSNRAIHKARRIRFVVFDRVGKLFSIHHYVLPGY